jgi:hypothetical protein
MLGVGVQIMHFPLFHPKGEILATKLLDRKKKEPKLNF